MSSSWLGSWLKKWWYDILWEKKKYLCLTYWKMLCVCFQCRKHIFFSSFGVGDQVQGFILASWVPNQQRCVLSTQRNCWGYILSTNDLFSLERTMIPKRGRTHSLFVCFFLLAWKLCVQSLSMSYTWYLPHSTSFLLKSVKPKWLRNQ